MPRFDIDIISRKQFAAAADVLSALSARAFALPPWNMQSCHRDHINRLLAISRTTLYVARMTETRSIAGFSIGTRLSESAFSDIPLERGPDGPFVGDYFLTWRAVDPEFQSLGIGRQLTVVRIEEATARSCRAIFGETIDRNFSVLAMHRELGFTRCHVQYLVGERGIYSKIRFRKLLMPFHQENL